MMCTPCAGRTRRKGALGGVPAVVGGWHKGKSRDSATLLKLTPAVVAGHLTGAKHIGLYPLTEKDSCWWIAADFDGSVAMLDALAYVKAARFRGIPAALEISQSGRGAHVWIFFTESIPAALARQLGTGLIHEAMGLRGSMTLSSYDRLFPSQDAHTGQGIGNLISAPLNGKRRNNDGTTLFLDTTTLEPYADQWAYLSSLDRLTPSAAKSHLHNLPAVRLGKEVRRLGLPRSSKIVPRPAMISTIKHAASMANPEFYDRQRQRRSTWNIPRHLRFYDETLEGDLITPRGLLASSRPDSGYCSPGCLVGRCSKPLNCSQSSIATPNSATTARSSPR